MLKRGKVDTAYLLEVPQAEEVLGLARAGLATTT